MSGASPGFLRTLKHRLDRSLTAQAALVFPLCVGIGALFRQDAPPVLWVVQGAFQTVIVVTIAGMLRRRFSRAAGAASGDHADLNRRIRHRDVPEDPAERETLRRLVDAQLRHMERAGRWQPYLMGFMGLIAVGLLVIGVLAGSVLPSLVPVALIAGICFWASWMRRRNMARHRYMRSAIEAE